MHRLAALIIAVAGACAVLAVPATVAAAGCDVLREPADRAECEARQQAREAARAEVARQVDGATPSAPGTSTASGRSAAWQDAVEEASGFDPGALIEPRPIAAVGGLAWFALLVRRRRRRARRTSAM